MQYTQPFDYLISSLLNNYINENDKELLKLVFAKTPSQEHLDKLLTKIDIDSTGLNRALLLSYLQHDNPNLHFSSQIAPRLKGLIKYFHFANITVLSHFSKIGKALNQTQIPILLIEGGAYNTLRPSLSRPMASVDFIIHKQFMKKAIKIGKAIGYSPSVEPHSVAFCTKEGQSVIGIYHDFFEPCKKTENFYTDIFARAKLEHKFGVDFFLPCYEDLFFLTLINLSKNLLTTSTIGNIFYVFCNCHFLLQNKEDFDWNIVCHNAKTVNKELELDLGIKFINGIVPNLIHGYPDNIINKTALNSMSNQSVFFVEYIKPLQEICQKILVVELKKNPKHFGWLILKLLIFKKLYKFPIFVQWYLRRKNKNKTA